MDVGAERAVEVSEQALRQLREQHRLRHLKELRQTRLADVAEAAAVVVEDLAAAQTADLISTPRACCSRSRQARTICCCLAC